MTHQKTTLPLQEGAISMPVQSLRVRVVEGKQAGEKVDAADETLTIGSAPGNDLVLDDETVSRYHLELVRAENGILLRDNGSTNGTFAGGICIHYGTIPPETKLRLGRCVVQVFDGERISVDLSAAGSLGALKGSSSTMRRLFAQVRKAARSNAAVLLVGESGTGKELIARALHDEGDRADKPFVTVDCASLMPTLVASELFGHEKGAFTGADRQHVGAFERAHGGTIFLDEIGELPEELQPNLLGVLERRRFRRLGGRDEIAVDVRVVAATNSDLRARVNTGSFRLDLYFRIAVVRLTVPPLRERVDDIPLLIETFLKQLGDDRSADEVVRATRSALEHHTWPGNVRELRNYVEAMVAMGELPELHEPADENGDFGLSRSAFLDLSYKQARAVVLQRFEAHYLPHIIKVAKGNVSRAARDRAMDRSHLGELLRRHGLR